MDMQALIQLIGSLGFPIAACCYIFYELNKERESHKLEMDKLSEALHNNTLVMQKLVDTLTFNASDDKR